MGHMASEKIKMRIKYTESLREFHTTTTPLHTFRFNFTKKPIYEAWRWRTLGNSSGAALTVLGKAS